MQSQNITTEIRGFVIANFLYGKADGLTDDDSLLDRGVIDSTGVLELVSFVQDKFGIWMEDDEVVPANLDSINNLADYICGKYRSNCREG